MKEKTPLSHEVVCVQILNLRPQNQIRGKLLVSRKPLHFRGSRFSQCFIPQPLPITRYQVRFYANNYFEYLPIVSTVFNLLCKFSISLQVWRHKLVRHCLDFPIPYRCHNYIGAQQDKFLVFVLLFSTSVVFVMTLLSTLWDCSASSKVTSPRWTIPAKMLYTDPIS